MWNGHSFSRIQQASKAKQNTYQKDSRLSGCWVGAYSGHWLLPTTHNAYIERNRPTAHIPYHIIVYLVIVIYFFFCFLFYLLIWLYYLSKVQHTPGIVQALCTTTIYHRIYQTCHVIRFCRRSVFSCFFFFVIVIVIHNMYIGIYHTYYTSYYIYTTTA